MSVKRLRRPRARVSPPVAAASFRASRLVAAKYAGEMAGPPRVVVDELQQAKVLRAVYSRRQLDEVLVDFWFNHFNVYAPKGPVKFFVAEYERDALRRYDRRCARRFLPSFWLGRGFRGALRTPLLDWVVSASAHPTVQRTAARFLAHF